MSNSARRKFRAPLHSWLQRITWVGMVSTIGLLSGWVPGLSQDFSSLAWSTAVYAQSSFSNDQVDSYAQVVLEMEPLRQRYYKQVKRLLGGTVPEDVCRQETLPKPVRRICDSFFKESEQIIEKRLSTGEFNQITRRAQTDSALKNRIQQALIRLQQNRR